MLKKKDAKRVIFVHWTNVGKKDGFNINFDKTLYKMVEDTIKDHSLIV